MPIENSLFFNTKLYAACTLKYGVHGILTKSDRHSPENPRNFAKADGSKQFAKYAGERKQERTSRETATRQELIPARKQLRTWPAKTPAI